ncbi:hypothetical protein L7F22_029481 [Adiantum nelumboides]|nr:hypothetical protein [Adiantum nelumboides]
MSTWHNVHVTNGYVYTLAGDASSWCSRLQKIVALSTTEAEYISATEASKEAIWLGRLVRDFGLPTYAPVLGCDSQSALCLAKNAMFHARTKHIDVRYHFIRQELDHHGLVTLTKVKSQDNPADVLTKCLAKTTSALLTLSGSYLKIPHRAFKWEVVGSKGPLDTLWTPLYLYSFILLYLGVNHP